MCASSSDASIDQLTTDLVCTFQTNIVNTRFIIQLQTSTK